MIHPLIGMPQGAEWLVILAIVVLVFGAAKLPELARGTGQALRIFKAETKGLDDDDSTSGKAATPEQREIEARNSQASDTEAERTTGEQPRRDDTTA